MYPLDKPIECLKRPSGRDAQSMWSR